MAGVGSEMSGFDGRQVANMARSCNDLRGIIAACKQRMQLLAS